MNLNSYQLKTYRTTSNIPLHPSRIISGKNMSHHPLTRESLRSLTNTGYSNATVTRKKHEKAIKSTSTKLSKDMINLQLDRSRVHVGDTIAGTVQLQENSPTSLVKLVLEGVQYTVVALKQSRDNNMGIEYLKKHTSEQQVLTRQEVLLDLSSSSSSKQPFRFIIPSGLPGTMKCVMSGTDPQLPSQCHIYYNITASIFKNTSTTQVSKAIVVIPQTEDTPLDSSISVSVINPIKSIATTLFQCGSLNAIETEDEQEGGHAVDECVLLGDDETLFLDKTSQIFSLTCDNSQRTLHLAGGQVVMVHVSDWLGRQLSGIWMMQLVEEITWWARGRSSSSISRWNLFANHHELPTTLQRTYENPHSLLSVKHRLIVYLTTNEEDPSKEVLACSQPFPISIVSNTRGWDA